jgi:hypothetical protein
MNAECGLAPLPQLTRALPDHVAANLRHAGCRRAGTGRERKYMQMREAAVFDKVERPLEHVVRLGRKAGDDIGAEDDVRSQAAHARAEGGCIGARMPALHALEDHVVARLQGKMQMRHQAWLVRKGIDQVIVDLSGIDRGEPQPRETGHCGENLLHHRPEALPAREMLAIAGEIDAGQHDFAVALFDQLACVGEDVCGRERTRISAPEWNNAERAAMVAAGLDLQKGAGAVFMAFERTDIAIAQRHDIGHGDLLRRAV